MATRDAEAVLTSNSSGLTATVDLQRDDGGSLSWNLVGGNLSVNSSGGLWKSGAFDSPSTRLVALFDGQSTTPENAVVVLEKVPASFIDRFCQSFSGSGSIVLGLVVTDSISWEMDVNPCA